MSNPFRGFFDNASETNRTLQNWMTGPHPGEVQSERGYADAWTPEADVISEGSELVILVELPGVERGDIDLSLSDDMLTISGHKRGRDTNGEYYTRERRFGTFRRSVTLPSGVRGQNVDAAFDGGILEITINDYASVSDPEQINVN